MTITELLNPLEIYCETDGTHYYLYDGQSVWDLDNDDRDSGGYFDILEVIDRVTGIWYDWIEEDLQDEFGCEEDFHGDFKAMQAWMDANQDVIYPETYAWYSEVIDSILNPWNVIDDAPMQD